MTDVTLTIHLPKDVHTTLERLAEATDKSRNALVREAVSRYVETEAEIVKGIKQAQAELQAGNGIAHDDVMREAHQIVERALARDSQNT